VPGNFRLAVQRLVFGLSLLVPILAGAEDARLPYSYLYRLQKTQADLAAAYPDLEIFLRLESLSPEVKPGDIHAFINSKSGKIPIRIGQQGGFSVPMRDDLLAEDPWLITNQPRGTMALNWKRGLAQWLVGQMTNSIHYARVMRALKDCDRVQEKMREIFPASPKLVASGLRVTFPLATQRGRVLIHSRDGERKLTADSTGSAIIPLDPDLLAEDPVMTFSVAPTRVELVFRNVESP
jgi:hypothetical protein